jgi:hypothetical protein
MVELDALLARTRVEGTCLVWTGPLNKDGYAVCYVRGLGRRGAGKKGPGKYVGAHRRVWELINGPIPEGLQIDHVHARGCRVRACLNVAHLELVTPAENSRRGLCGVLRTHCRHGHELTEENTVRRGGRRDCRTCSRDRGREYARRKRGSVLPAAGLRSHCPQGHEYTPGNTYTYRGRRSCRACHNAVCRARRVAA